MTGALKSKAKVCLGVLFVQYYVSDGSGVTGSHDTEANDKKEKSFISFQIFMLN